MVELNKLRLTWRKAIFLNYIFCQIHLICDKCWCMLSIFQRPLILPGMTNISEILNEYCIINSDSEPPCNGSNKPDDGVKTKEQSILSKFPGYDIPENIVSIFALLLSIFPSSFTNVSHGLLSHFRENIAGWDGTHIQYVTNKAMKKYN